jgi:hypothetical protein
MDDEKTFAKVFQSHGAAIGNDELDLHSPWLKRLFRAYRYMEPNINIGLLNNMNFNAIARNSKGRDFIAIYSGTFTQIAGYAYCIFSDPKMFPYIGDSSAEYLENSLIETLSAGGINPGAGLRYFPNDLVRRDSAQCIAECACMILFFHEAAHINGCHLDLIVDELDVTEHQELMAIPVTQEESLLLRTLELEADSIALANGLTVWRNLFAGEGYSAIAPLGATRSWRIAAQLLFWTMSFNHSRERGSHLATHPSPLTRMANIRTIQGLRGIDSEILDAHERREDSLHSWMVKNAPPSPIVVVPRSRALDEEIAEEMVVLQDRAKILWPRLEEYQSRRSKRWKVGTLLSMQ